jgi:hypothetical protein
MAFAALAIGAPVAVGLPVGHSVQGVLVAVCGLVGALADRADPYPIRAQRIAVAGTFGGVAGLSHTIPTTRSSSRRVPHGWPKGRCGRHAQGG